MQTGFPLTRYVDEAVKDLTKSLVVRVLLNEH